MPNLFLVSNLWALKTPWLLRSITFPEAGELSSFFLFDLGSLGRVVWFCFKIVNSSKLYFLAMINIFLAFRDFFFHITSDFMTRRRFKKKKKERNGPGPLPPPQPSNTQTRRTRACPVRSWRRGARRAWNWYWLLPRLSSAGHNPERLNYEAGCIWFMLNEFSSLNFSNLGRFV